MTLNNYDNEVKRLDVALRKYQLLVNSATYLTMESNLVNDALKLRVKDAIANLIRTEALGDVAEVI